MNPIQWLVWVVVLAVPVWIVVGLSWAIYQDLRDWPKRRRKKRLRQERGPWIDDWYDDQHRAERTKYAEVIREHGGQCMEKVCVLQSRRIEAGATWDLAHDHERGGQHDYLGPAHPECNKAEARSRGVVFNDHDEGNRNDKNSWSRDESADDHPWWSSEPPYAEPADNER